MPRQYKLTWIPGYGQRLPRWRKKYQGQAYYFNSKPDETKDESHLRCWQAWRKLKAQIDKASPASTPLDQIRYRDVWKAPTVYRSIIPGVTFGQTEHYRDTPDEAITDLAASAVVQAFLKHKRAQAKSGQRSLSRYDALRIHLERFCRWFGPQRTIEEISAQGVAEFYQHLAGGVKNKAFSDYTARDTWSALKQFIRWCWRQELIPLPRNLEDKDLVIKLRRRRIKTIDIDVVKLLLRHAGERTRLFLLLAINCGMTQADMSDLRPDQVDWQKGRIRRKRSKTDDHEDAPEVDYPLWDPTFELLKKHRSKDKSHALLNARGEPLKTQALRADGKLAVQDNVRSAFNRLLRKKELGAKAKGVTLKQLRATSPSVLATHAEYGRYAQYFLGHAPSSVADTHYVVPDQRQFDKAVRWLGKRYGVG